LGKDRAIGFCVCIDRKVLDEVGGFDERFAVGNFEDDDLSLRVRAAGYQIYVCDDSFIHHFGSQSFLANKVDYMATMHSNWAKFSAKWGYAGDYPVNGYDPRAAIIEGFDRARHFAALPVVTEEAAQEIPIAAAPDVTFMAAVEDEASWTKTAEFVRRYVQAFTADSPVSLVIGTGGEPPAETIGQRLARLLEKLNIPEERSPDIAVSDEDDLDAWRSGVHAPVVIDTEKIKDRSPSALRRLLQDAVK
jgi:hypothetical protein